MSKSVASILRSAVVGPINLRAVAASQGFAPPVSITKLLQRLAVKTFDATVTTPSPEALGGQVHLTIRGDGTYELEVNIHDSGAPDYSFRLGILLLSTSGNVFPLYSRGTVRGSDFAFTHPTATGFREFHDPLQGSSDVLRDDWAGFSIGSLQVNREWKDNLVEWAESLVIDKFAFILGAVTIGAPGALMIWGASVLGDVADIRLPGELGLVGLVAAEGQFFLAGPEFFVPVFIAGVLVSAALFKRRGLHSEEKAELQKVFRDTLDYDSIIITNLEGIGGRPFTLFNLDGQIVVAASSSVFPDFDNLLTSNTTKRVFIHELTHAWQYQHRRTLTRLCQIIRTRGEEVVYGQDAVYKYTPGGRWDEDYNMEQQAEIVADWYFNKFVADESQRNADVINTNEHYILGNILMGQA